MKIKIRMKIKSKGTYTPASICLPQYVFFCFHGEAMTWKDFFDRLGMNGTQWQWRIMRWQRQWEEWKAGMGAGRRPEGARKFKFCESCGAMLEPADTKCVRCGARAPRWMAWRIKRIAGLVLPSWCPVSTLILVANIANFALVAALYGMRALVSPSIEVLVGMGALVPPIALQGAWWQIITYGYLHIGLLHIGFNMFALSQVGPVLEERIGGARFYTLYTLSLVGGAVADLLLRGGVFIVIAGASGALFGLIGFGVAQGHFAGGQGGRLQRDFFLRWAVYGFVFGFLIGADNIAHMGGFIAGALMGFLIEKERRMRDRLVPIWRLLAWLLCGATLTAFAGLWLSK